MNNWTLIHINWIKYYPQLYSATILIFLLCGWLYGKYRLKKSDKIIIRDPLLTAIFGLSALVLGFTFSNAADNYDHRINIIRDEASSINKVYQSAQFLNVDDRAIVQASLREILNKRLNTYTNIKYFEQVNLHIDELNALLSKVSIEITQAIPRAPEASKELANQLLRPQLSDLLVTFQAGIHNSLHHPPEIIEVFLYVLLAISALLAGYSMAVQKEEDWFLTVLYLGLMGFAIYVIFALAYPNQILSFNSINADLIRLQKSLP